MDDEERQLGEEVNYQMLEIRHVTKIYRTKGGADTRALDDVSITFGNTGLVFLLGKSGSGKSTLLNVSGGLDEPTSGEIIVKGKSSKNFSGSDFDSYRNTFVGFIFQEYNILDEFNVEDNVALALELQGKPKDKEKIHSLLRAVELEAYAKRKPNTLSGGQKQRIAIARALVKDPQIIMADEPTGALDSNTGKQVFDTLKNLSKTRLVIVVSHDREFAEIYGDRIVELADGKIISDVTKIHVPPEELDENVSIVNGNTLSIKSGAKLTEENLKTISDFIAKTEKDVIITNGKREISAFKKVNRMSENGLTERFDATPDDAVVKKEYTPEESKFIRSRLPVAKAIKIGASGLKLKPIRLAFTILLSVISFIMFGLLSTLMMYDGDAVLVSSFVNSDCDYLNLNKGYLTHYDYYDYSYASRSPLNFTDKELEEFQTKFGKDSFAYYACNSRVVNVEVDDRYEYYYTQSIGKFVSLPEEHGLVGKMRGEYPQSVREVCISDYLFKLIKENSYYGLTVNKDGTFKADTETSKINSEEDIIGKYIALSIDGSSAFKVTGVFDSGKIPAKYDVLKDRKTENYMTMYEYQSYLQEGLKCAMLVSDSFIENYSSEFNSPNANVYVDVFESCDTYFNGYCESGNFFYDGEKDEYVWKEAEDRRFLSTSYVLAYEKSDKLDKYFVGGNQPASLAADEIIINIADSDLVFKKSILEYYLSVAADEAYAKYAAFEKDVRIFDSGESLEEVWVEDPNGGYYEYNLVKHTAQERLAALERVVEVLGHVQPVTVRLEMNGNVNKRNLTVAGVYAFCDFTVQINGNGNGIIFSEKFIDNNVEIYKRDSNEYTNYVPEEGLKYSGIMLPYDKSAAGISAVLGIVGEENAKPNDVIYTLVSGLYNEIESVNYTVEMMSTIFLWVGVVFAVFSALLLFNFISVSIANKTKEIGILRAVGARGLDVFKIFFAESGIIVGICLLIALIGSAVLCSVLNGIMMADTGISVTLFVFGPASVGVLVGIAVAVAVISTFLPVFLASRKKPVESIRAL